MKLKSEPWVLGKNIENSDTFWMSRDLLTLQMGNIQATQGLLLCRSDSGVQAECEPVGTEKDPQKCW